MHIVSDEDFQLFQQLKENTMTPNVNYIPYPTTPNACVGCSSHPSNGGSGICNCTLGSQNIITC